MTANLLLVSEAHGHDAVVVHPWITRQALEYLKQTEPDVSANISKYLDKIVAGSEHEDNYYIDGDQNPKTFRSSRHFFRPTDNSGLRIDEVVMPSSYEWGGQQNSANLWDYQDALKHYQAGNLEEAFFALGHVVHLLQDLTVPSHVHLDKHGPPDGDDFENYCLFADTAKLAANLPTPQESVLKAFDSDVAALWQKVAQATYWRSLVPGDLTDQKLPQGQIAVMFPELKWLWWQQTWSIERPPVGTLGSAFWEATQGYFYFRDTENPAAWDRVNFDPHNPQTMRFAANNKNTIMAELLARDLIPLAVIGSAALIRRFENEAQKLPMPTVAPAQDANLSGHCQAQNGARIPALVFVAGLAYASRRGRRK